jgi:hypothetical protein
MARPAEFQRAVDSFSDWRWRLNNLYWITDKGGRRVRFEMNWAQERLFSDMHYMNAILKARQLGFTTFIQIFMLDACVFNSNIRAGTIAHTLQDAQAIFRDKIKYPYDNLPDQIRNQVAPQTDSVGTSLRSGTMQYLHISEYGKLCAKYPDKAREVRTGALNTVQSGQVVFIESTAEGQEGHFFQVCECAQAMARTGSKLTPLDFKFHFFPWWQAPEYRLDPDGVPIPDDMARYFAKIEESNGIKLDAAQQAWYVKKSDTQLGDMKREYPSTPKEAFEASVEGAYYGALLEAAETHNRVGDFKADPAVPVHTAWDIGRSDYTSIWFWQRFVGKVRLVGFFQNCGEGMPYYATEVKRLYAERGWLRKDPIDVFPHDAKVTEWGSDKSRIEQLLEKGFKPHIAPEVSLDDGINAVRATLPMCEFDQEACSDGVKVLKSYRKEWDDELGKFKDRPRHDWASHGADSFRYLALAHRDLVPPVEKPKPKINTRQPTLNEIMKEHERSRRFAGNRI